MSCVWEGDSPALTQLRDSKQQHIDKNNKLTDSWKSVVVKMVIILMVRMENSPGTMMMMMMRRRAGEGTGAV